MLHLNMEEIVISKSCFRSIHVLMRPQWLLEKRLKAQIMTHSLTVGGEHGRNDGKFPLENQDFFR